MITLVGRLGPYGGFTKSVFRIISNEIEQLWNFLGKLHVSFLQV